MRILIVDDSEDSCDITAAALLSAGYKDIATAHSAQDAFRVLNMDGDRPNDPVPMDVILLDILMPGVDGIETCARIRNDGRYNDVPIIMITQLNDMDSLANAFVAGANDYITKPVNRIELLARIRAALRLKAELSRRQEREQELLNFVANWGDRRATVWIDNVTGLFVGEIAEAYLVASPGSGEGRPISVIALAVDRLDALRAAKGDAAANAVLARIAATVRDTGARIGVVAAAYRNGLIVLVAPGYDAEASTRLAETLRMEIARMALANIEATAADHVTVSMAVVSGAATRDANRIRLLTQAIRSVQGSSARGGNEVVAMSA